MRHLLTLLALTLLPGLVLAQKPKPKKPAAPPKPTHTIVVAEGEKFVPQGENGWKVTHQQDSYASHTYGGMWVTHGGLIGAPANAVNVVATQTVTIPAAGKYRVWSKYQAPPYFNYLHRIEVVQNGKTVFGHVFGKAGTDRLWSFSGVSNELWWPWGVDHDAAESPKEAVELAAGPAEFRLIAVENPKPAGDRFVDFVVLTTNLEDDYDGFKPYQVGSPMCLEALAASKFYLRFRNTAAAPARLSVLRAGHFQPQYGGATTQVPEEPVAAGQWSEWVNIGPFCRLVHDEGLKLDLAGATELAVQFARDPAGKDVVGDVTLPNGEWVVLPIDVTWNKNARVKASRDLAAELIKACKSEWKPANGGKKPKEIAFFGAFTAGVEYAAELKDALGYNTTLPAKYEQLKPGDVYAHAGSLDAIRNVAQMPGVRSDLRVLSFGDEISLGRIDFKDPKNQEKFREWLKAKNVTANELGAAPETVSLAESGDNRVVWYANLFNEEERFAAYRAMTEEAKKLIRPDLLTGANYSPHHLALCYGPVFQWVDIFKHNGMSMFWAEDYIFSVPEAPQMQSWMLSQARCGVKYNKQPIHFYVMPHAPGQEPGFLRRNTLLSIGLGCKHIDSFWVAPAERFTENYVGWGYRDTFKVLHDTIYETAEVEKLAVGGTVRPARVAVVTGKATDFNESRLMIDKAADPFAGQCKNAPEKLNQIICRKDQQMLYLALKHAQHAVDLVTEDDIADGVLKDYDVVYFAGEWVDTRAAARLDDWVKAGGVLYAAAGLGHRNQFDQPETALLKLLGLKDVKTTKNLVVMRTLLELPLVKPIDTITLDGETVPAVGMKQVLTPDAGTTVLGTWSDGSAAVTVRSHGKGKAFAVGTLAGTSYIKTGLRVQPWARGGRHTLYNPENFSAAATKLVQLGVQAGKPTQAAVCSHPLVEAIVTDSPAGTLLTLVNWSNAPVKGLSVAVRCNTAPASAKVVGQQKAAALATKDGVTTITLDLQEAEYVVLK